MLTPEACALAKIPESFFVIGCILVGFHNILGKIGQVTLQPVQIGLVTVTYMVIWH